MQGGLRKHGTRALWLVAATLLLFVLGSGNVTIRAGGQEPAAEKQQPDPEPDAGGPSGDSNGIAIPKKKEKAPEEEKPAPEQPKVKTPPGMEPYSLHVDVPVVTVNVGVTLQKTRQFVPNLQKENFRIYEDGVPQQIAEFRRIQAPITALLLCEFASTNYWFVYDMRTAAYAFAQQLKPEDYIAIMTYDMRTQILTDFTQDKRAVYESLNSLQIPGFSERNVFDALYESLDRLSRIEGQKYIILIGSGRDTFSKINLDKILQKVKATPNVTIFTVSTGQTLRILSDNGMGGMGQAMVNMEYLQADNQMRTFAKLTGGLSFFPRFEGEMPEIFTTINDSIRNQYEIVYRPSNAKQDGTYRKLHVELVDGEGKPLRMQDEKHHQLKYEIEARDGYRAHEAVE